MKRSPAPKRRTRLRPKSLKRGRRRTQAKRDSAYMEFVRGLDCWFAHLSECMGRIDPHHAGWNHSKGEGKGTGIKAPDDTCVPLCRGHHQALETLSSPFKRVTKEQRRRWADETIAAVRAMYAERGSS